MIDIIWGSCEFKTYFQYTKIVWGVADGLWRLPMVDWLAPILNAIHRGITEYSRAMSKEQTRQIPRVEEKLSYADSAGA